MGSSPTEKSIIGTFINGRNSQDDFLQLANNHGGTVFGWIDADGVRRGTLAGGGPPTDPEPANTILAGPVSGSDAAPQFRDLVAADLNPARPAELDATGFAGASWDQKVIAAFNALPAEGGIINAVNFTSTQSCNATVDLSSKPTTLLIGAYQLNMNAAIVISYGSIVGQSDGVTFLLKGFNGVMISGTGNVFLQGLYLAGDSGAVFTGNLVTVTSGNQVVVRDCTIDFYTTGGFSSNGFIKIEDTTVLGENSSTGDGITSTGGILNINNCFMRFSGTGKGVVCGAQAYINGTAIVMGVNSQEAVTGSPVTIASCNVSTPSGTHPIITSSACRLSGNVFGCSGGGGLSLSNDAVVVGNFFNFSPSSSTSGAAAILVSTDALGVTIADNLILFDSGETPAGDNYGVRLYGGLSGSDFIGNTVVNNVVEGHNSIHDIGFFHDNTGGNSAMHNNVWQNNQCVDIGTAYKGSDTSGVVTGTFLNNDSQSGTLYNLTSGRFRVNSIYPINFANIPTGADGSSLYIVDGTSATPVAGSGVGTFAVRVNNAWSGVGGASFSVPTLIESATHTPSSAADTGITGQIAWDASFIYICTATNTWKRVAISTW